MSEDTDGRRDMVLDFVTESREMLDDVEPKIMELEKHAENSGDVDDEILNSIFRLFHSVKGMSSFVDLQTITTVTHEAETLLDLIRKRQIAIDTGHVDLLYRTCDFIRSLLDKVEVELSDEQYAQDAVGLIRELKQVIADGQNPIKISRKPDANMDETIVSDIDAVREQDEDNEPANTEESIDSTSEIQFMITPEIAKRFVDEAIEIFCDVEGALLELETKSGDRELVERAFRGFHSFKGNAGFFGFNEFESLSHKAENVLVEIRDNGCGVSVGTISVLLDVVDALREGVVTLSNEKGAKVKNKAGLEKMLHNISTAGQTMEITEIEQNSQMPVELEIAATIVQEEKKPDGPSGSDDAAKKDDSDKKIVSKQSAIRVDVDKLDSLLDLVGELVIAEAMVSHNPDLRGLQLDRFEKAVLQLTKITRDIQDISMSLRMIPLAGVFNKMVRLVRDLSVKSNKKIDLEIIGEETEVDKTIIEQISDPLVHLIRNSADHGLESTEERVAAGKSDIGKIMLEAKHSAGEVWIVVKDNGRGLNRDKILRKAIDRGLTRDENLKDEDVWKLIFEPGLSTAEQVSSISGRGVGMDVVKRNIEKLRGRIDIRSSPGQGTAIIVRIPLTLAIIEGMVVKVGKSLCTIPIVSIKESFRPEQKQITITPEGLEIVDIRGELLPIIRLHELYNIEPTTVNLNQGILIVAESETKKCCLFVDELIGQQQIVIKPLSEYLGLVRGVSGFAILGGGEVSMILDIAGLIDSVSTKP